MRKILAALLALAMVLALVPAVMAEGEEPITLTVFRGEMLDNPAEDNKIYKLIEDEFGIKFEFEYCPSENLDETLGLKLQDLEDLPDLFDGSNSADTICDGGALINLMDYINETDTPRLWAHIMKQANRVMEKDEEGNPQLFIIPNYGLNDGDQIVNEVNGPAFFIQKQVLAWDNYPQIKTLNQYFDLIERFLAANPTNADGTPYVGFDIMSVGWQHFCLINPVQHLMGRPNDGEVLIDVSTDEYKTETFIDKPYAKAYYKKLNEEFQKGLIKADTFVMNTDQYKEHLSTGLVLGMFDQTWDFGDATNALLTDKKYENTYVALGLVYDPEYVDGKEIEEHYVNGSVPNIRRGFGISVSCKCPERIIKMWEEMLSERWQLIFNWGIEGEDYSIVDGRLTMTAEQWENTTNAEWIKHNKARAFFESSPKKQGYILEGDLAGNCWEPKNQPEIVLDNMNEYDKNFLKAYGYSKFADFVNPPIELAPYGEAWQINYDAESEVGVAHTDFCNIQDQRLPECIMCDPAEFDAKWDAFVEEVKPSATIFENFMQQAVLDKVAQFYGK